MLKVLLFVASALPALLLLKSLLFRKPAGKQASVSEFNKHMGYLSKGIVVVLALSLLYIVYRTVAGR